MNYSQLDREVLAIVFGVNYFRKFLLGKSFFLVTDNEPLTTSTVYSGSLAKDFTF